MNALSPTTRLSRSRQAAGRAMLMAGLLPLSVAAQERGAADAAQRLGADEVAIARLFIAPFVGVYGAPGALVSDSTVRLRQSPALALGARARVPLASVLGLEAALAWTPSVLSETDSEGLIEHPGGVLLGSVRGTADVFNTTGDMLSGFLAAGFGILWRHGRGWDGLTGTTDPALTVAGGIRMRMPGRGPVWIFEGELFSSRTAFLEYTNERRGDRAHLELVLSIGAAFPALRR